MEPWGRTDAGNVQGEDGIPGSCILPEIAIMKEMQEHIVEVFIATHQSVISPKLSMLVHKMTSARPMDMATLSDVTLWCFPLFCHSLVSLSIALITLQ